MGLHFQRCSSVKWSVIQESAQPRPQSLKLPDNVRLLDVVGKQIDRNRFIVNTLLEQIENYLSRVITQPLILRLIALGVVIQRLRLGTNVFVGELTGVRL